MGLNFKDFMSQIATDSSEDAKFTAEDIQSVVDEVTAKDNEILNLKEELEKKNREHEDLKNRIVEKLFSNPKGTPEQEEDEGTDNEGTDEVKTFDELINPDYRIRN